MNPHVRKALLQRLYELLGGDGATLPGREARNDHVMMVDVTVRVDVLVVPLQTERLVSMVEHTYRCHFLARWQSTKPSHSVVPGSENPFVHDGDIA